MTQDEQEPPIGGPTAKERKPWFGPNRSGVGYRPYRWQGWVILLGIVAAIIALVVLFRTGVM
jgi:hypothetical protein